uniref:Globin domain-containing protein n=1 Tax=Leptobrachium leishanense TaxID=445787 RepID=A0A8C5MR64_9ANUR
MSFSDAEKAIIVSMCEKMASQVEVIGAEAFERLFMTNPLLKSNFNHLDLSHGSPDLLKHGGKVMNALGNAAGHLDDLSGALPAPSELRVDPGNFSLLSNSILVTLATRFGPEFTPFTQSAWDKFLAAVPEILVSK